MVTRKEMLILSQLRRNARQPLIKISNKIGVPISTIYDRIKSCEGNVIKKYATIVDFPKIGFNIRKKILVKVKNPNEFQRFASENPHVNSIYKLSSEFDFLLDCIFMYMNDHDNFNTQMDQAGVLKRMEFFVTEAPKQESFMVDPEFVNKL